MKPVAFDYVRAESVEHVCALLAEDPDARIIAGGQTLMPMLAMRLARPSRLVDILRVPGLSGIDAGGDDVTFGATTRQADIERSPVVAAKLPLLAQAMPWVGHQPTRNRGTIGGSLVNADPSAEIALVAVTLGAALLLRTADEESEAEAEGFFFGPMITAMPEGGCLTAVRFPVWSGRVGTGFHEISARRSDFAFVSAAAQVELDADGVCVRCAAGVGGATDVPERLDLEDALTGRRLDDDAIAAAVTNATAALDTNSDLHATAAYRKRVAGALARRALADARNSALRAAA